MTCTRSRFKKSATRVERKDPEKDVPWILAETEEEWVQWEKTREKLKSKLKRTDTEVVNNPSAPSTSSKRVNLRDKVTSWKAHVDRSFHEDEDIIHELKSSNPAATRGSQQSSTKKRASPLDFPVVKPSALKTNKDNKSKQKTSESSTNPHPPPQSDLDTRRFVIAVLPASISAANREPPPEQTRGASKSVRSRLNLGCTSDSNVGLC